MHRNAPGVYNEAQSTVVIGELGRDPVGIDVAGNFLGYKKTTSKMQKKTYCFTRDWNKQKYRRVMQRNIKLWINHRNATQNILETTYNISGFPRTRKGKYDIAPFRYLYAESWTNKINHQRKMGIYMKFEWNFHPEDYLALKDERTRKAITSLRLRISAHGLAI